ncbi:hypothetical protein G7Y89_g12530 [Cudoniella acicularis]|uniref:Uncharacterized protein n=1 Tax=Cudoniella acicularis TaxID=354080 RepID=A0A8H4VZ30_9HELO|nr:hypothetical protein G7Y89_g12530 [Cudoniella acicularis]
MNSNLALGEALKDSPTPSLSTGPLTPECASRQQKPFGLQTDLPTGGGASGEPSTAKNLPISPPALESPSNGRLTTNNPSRGYQPAENSAKNLLMAEDPSRILVAEGISNDTAITGGTERIINNSIEEVSDSNEPLSLEDKSRHSRFKRTFEEMDESITYDDDTNSETAIADKDDEPLLKKHKGAILGIDILIKATKAELVETAQVFHRLRKGEMKINDPI